jgi:hypothetical protein
MGEDTGPKSAYELAMERLRKKDEAEGVETLFLTDDQKTAIAEVRRFYEAQLAQREVMHRSALNKLNDPDAIDDLREEYQHDRERITSERERKIGRIRAGEKV